MQTDSMFHNFRTHTTWSEKHSHHKREHTTWSKVKGKRDKTS